MHNNSVAEAESSNYWQKLK